eukprot:Hpha_TRINITY_DN5415_c0_g1::TRINITY_DN5415_c0_g1_i1::g.192399::m.192399
MWRRTALRLAAPEGVTTGVHTPWGGGSFSQYRPPRVNKEIPGSGIYPHVAYMTHWSVPQGSPPGEFQPREQVFNMFKKPETCFEYYRRLYSIGWTTSPIGEGLRSPPNGGTKFLVWMAVTLGVIAAYTQWWYIVGINYPKTFTQDWAEAEVLHPRLWRFGLQREDYTTLATFGHFDVRWPRWTKLEE